LAGGSSKQLNVQGTFSLRIRLTGLEKLQMPITKLQRKAKHQNHGLNNMPCEKGVWDFE
jgi:hypothetical protein